MKCRDCGNEWGVDAWPELQTMGYITRRTRMIGIETKIEDECIWKLDYKNETEEESDLLEWNYVCSYCGSTIKAEEIKEVVKYSARQEEK